MTEFDRILVLVPHPDDEALLAAGIIRRAVLSGRHVSVAIVTNGDYLCSDYSKGEARLRESLDAMLFLGMEKCNIYFLGYPDTGFEPQVSFLSRLEKAEENEIIKASTGRQIYGIKNVHEDFCFQRTAEHGLYTKSAFLQDLNALIEKVNPSLVITTAESDCHGDHSALFRFVKNALAHRSTHTALWCGMVHSPDGDLAWPKMTKNLSEFEAPAKSWGENLLWQNKISVPIPREMLAVTTEDSSKYKLLLQYKTALNPSEPEVCEYLLSFAKNEEIFWSIEVILSK